MFTASDLFDSVAKKVLFFFEYLVYEIHPAVSVQPLLTTDFLTHPFLNAYTLDNSRQHILFISTCIYNSFSVGTDDKICNSIILFFCFSIYQINIIFCAFHCLSLFLIHRVYCIISKLFVCWHTFWDYQEFCFSYW